jgi:hypothetical protein
MPSRYRLHLLSVLAFASRRFHGMVSSLIGYIGKYNIIMMKILSDHAIVPRRFHDHVSSLFPNMVEKEINLFLSDMVLVPRRFHDQASSLVYFLS